MPHIKKKNKQKGLRTQKTPIVHSWENAYVKDGIKIFSLSHKEGMKLLSLLTHYLNISTVF